MFHGKQKGIGGGLNQNSPNSQSRNFEGLVNVIRAIPQDLETGGEISSRLCEELRITIKTWQQVEVLNQYLTMSCEVIPKPAKMLRNLL